MIGCRTNKRIWPYVCLRRSGLVYCVHQLRVSQVSYNQGPEKILYENSPGYKVNFVLILLIHVYDKL